MFVLAAAEHIATQSDWMANVAGIMGILGGAASILWSLRARKS